MTYFIKLNYGENGRVGSESGGESRREENSGLARRVCFASICFLYIYTVTLSSGSVAWQRSGRTVQAGSHTQYVRPGSAHHWGLMPALFPCSLSCPSSPILVPLYLIPSSIFCPHEKKSARCCRFESLSDSGFIAQFLAFCRSNKTLTDI